jgi:homocysteine S-methyltransferase
MGGAAMSNVERLESRLKAGDVIIMDGGTGTEIQRRGTATGPTAWSAEPMPEHPDLIREIHEDYIEAGAEIIITNTFSTSRDLLEEAGIAHRTAELNQLGVKLAQEARERAASDRPVLIAGSMSTLLPKSNPAVKPSYEEALAIYREQAKLLADAGVEVIVAEMIIRTLDARAAVQAIRETGLPAWVGYSVQRDGEEYFLGLHGRHAGETIAQAVEVVAVDGVTALFVMHSLSEDTGPALHEMRRHTSLPLGAYAHAVELKNWEEPDPDALTLGTVTPDEYLAYAREWVDAGAQIIGGCCGTSPEHIKPLKNNLPVSVPRSPKTLLPSQS